MRGLKFAMLVVCATCAGDSGSPVAWYDDKTKKQVGLVHVVAGEEEEEEEEGGRRRWWGGRGGGGRKEEDEFPRVARRV